MAAYKVLLPVDGSDFSRQIFSYVRKFLNPQSSALILLRVAHHPEGIAGEPGRLASSDVAVSTFDSERDVELNIHPIYASQEWDSLEAALIEQLQPDAQSLREIGFEVSIVIRSGDPADAIIEFVKEEDISLVAMTTHGRSGLSRLVFGSVAYKVMHTVSVPVTLLQPSLISPF
ncbi:MAG: universal stress protein [Chloroflexi bacterium]|nr:universal stress protein [Chloroflexota bacterium]